MINAIRRLFLRIRSVTRIEACDKRSHPKGLEVDIQGQYKPLETSIYVLLR
ncbi:Unknown protein sequence [Pseudomonas syringae pv. maculicola str. M6]|nr:Unknown protein sequence [Pseudomonas syringae pv. maculicola str. M6]